MGFTSVNFQLNKTSGLEVHLYFWWAEYIICVNPHRSQDSITSSLEPTLPILGLNLFLSSNLPLPRDNNTWYLWDYNASFAGKNVAKFDFLKEHDGHKNIGHRTSLIHMIFSHAQLFCITKFNHLYHPAIMYRIPKHKPQERTCSNISQTKNQTFQHISMFPWKAQWL